jgi:hypothetical protein
LGRIGFNANAMGERLLVAKTLRTLDEALRPG